MDAAAALRTVGRRRRQFGPFDSPPRSAATPPTRVISLDDEYSSFYSKKTNERSTPVALSGSAVSRLSANELRTPALTYASFTALSGVLRTDVE